MMNIAVLIPCFNEEITISSMVTEFRQQLPASTVYVYDNNSSDRTSELAADAGAVVRHESIQGKGAVVRRMFADIDADIYIIVDGDGTYDVPSVNQMINKLVDERLDMVVGARLDSAILNLYPPGHRLGNVIISKFVRFLFGSDFTDILSGYRVFSKRFVKTFPALSSGFEVETELTVHSLAMKLPVAEFPTPYYRRAEGSSSKLNTFRDGARIFLTIISLFKEFRPFIFFGLLFLFFAITSVVFSIPLLFTYLETGLVPQIPMAIVSSGIMLLAFISLVSGIILNTLYTARWEAKRAHYQSFPGLPDSISSDNSMASTPSATEQSQTNKTI